MKDQLNTPLAQPININTVKIQNRLVKSAIQENMADENGVIKHQYLKLYHSMSKGGAGLIITGHMYVHLDGRTYQGMAGIDSDEKIRHLKKVTEIVHKNKAKIFAQINHAGSNAYFENRLNKRIKAPSMTGKTGSLTINDIERIIEDFGISAKRIKKAGFDGIELHGAHSYLIAQFLSKKSNKRKDRYGGKIENRQRFCLEVFQRIRENVGSSYPVIIKLDAYSDAYLTYPHPMKLITLKDSLNTAKKLEEKGIDALEISCGFKAARGAMPFRELIAGELLQKGYSQKAKLVYHALTPMDVVLNRNLWFKPHHNLKNIIQFKKQLSIPILAGSCFRNPIVMKKVIENNEADMISLGRPLINDPNFAQKILNGSDKQSTCINCNLCLTLLPLGKPVKCYNGKAPPIT